VKPVLRILIAGWLGLQVLFASAQIPASRVDQYMALSGIDAMLSAMPGEIEAVVDQLLRTAGNSEAERGLMGVLAGAWKPDAVRASVQDYLQEASSPAEIDSLLAWKVNPLAKKIMAAEMESYSPSFREQLGRHIENLQDNPPDEETARAISGLIARAHIAELMVESTVLTTGSLAMALIESGMVEGSQSVVDMYGELDTMRAQLRPRMERQATLVSYYIYRDISNAELNRYSDFYETDLGKREVVLAYGAMEAAMSHWTEESVKILLAGLEAMN
jgi:hypothetical protein